MMYPTLHESEDEGRTRQDALMRRLLSVSWAGGAAGVSGTPCSAGRGSDARCRWGKRGDGRLSGICTPWPKDGRVRGDDRRGARQVRIGRVLFVRGEYNANSDGNRTRSQQSMSRTGTASRNEEGSEWGRSRRRVKAASRATQVANADRWWECRARDDEERGVS